MMVWEIEYIVLALCLGVGLIVTSVFLIFMRYNGKYMKWKKSIENRESMQNVLRGYHTDE